MYTHPYACKHTHMHTMYCFILCFYLEKDSTNNFLVTECLSFIPVRINYPNSHNIEKKGFIAAYDYRLEAIPAWKTRWQGFEKANPITSSQMKRTMNSYMLPCAQLTSSTLPQLRIPCLGSGAAQSGQVFPPH